MRESGGILADLAASGLTPAQFALVAELAAAVATEARPIVDEAAQRRREKDREYQAARRRQNRQTSADSSDKTPSPLVPPKVSPTPPSSNPPLSPNPEARARPCLLKGIGLPDWMPAEPWQAFVRMRKAIPKVPFTEDAARGVVRKVGKLRGQGFDPAKLLWKAVDHGWRTVFEHDDCKVTVLPVQRDAAWHEDQARFFEKIGRTDDAAEHRKRATSIGALASDALRRTA